MDGSDAEGLLVVNNLGESGFLHHLLEGFLVGKFENRVGQVLVGAAFGDQAADPGENLAEIKVVDFLKQAAIGVGEFEDHRFAAGLEHPAHLPESGGAVDDVADAEGDGDAVELAVGMGHGLAGGGDQGDTVAIRGTGDLLLADLQHPRRQVGADDGQRGGGLGGDLQGDIAGAGGDVENPAVFGQIQLLDGEGPPAAVDAEGKQTVEQIVTGGDGVEHLADAAPFFGKIGHGFTS